MGCAAEYIGRKRRAFISDDEDEDWDEDADEDYDSDPMDGSLTPRRITGSPKKDIKKFTLLMARWIKFQVYDQGGECQFLGHRMLARLDRLRWYMFYAYCKQVDESQSFCRYFYRKFDGEHPRDHGKPLKKFPKPSRDDFE